MVSLEVALSDRATMTHAEPFHFSRKRSKSAPEVGPTRQPLCVPETELK